jgi:hypothetical protein
MDPKTLQINSPVWSVPYDVPHKNGNAGIINLLSYHGVGYAQLHGISPKRAANPAKGTYFASECHEKLFEELFWLYGIGHVDIPPSVFAYHDGLIGKMATDIYQNHAFEDMPILADAIEDAGFYYPTLLNHCREPGRFHVRGCWVLDALLEHLQPFPPAPKKK